ncbi:capsule assembly Wzi family protein [Shewanella sp. Isolate7]|uniref:capsule assembly Wzi family protein n=1 Tax=Shewanella sp. Isolate7 TaxID=2908528 RepID=UPI001EFD240D|nr:capsule assembly Wzi family protein [Shewanella sp. Isolate7]MCG9722205.1 capsule assembly Wzi family protein [Shewanella sp. Isolate7]
MRVVRALLFTLVAWFTMPVYAAPWVDTSDIYLRADIQALADAGAITVPVNTYPLMWSGIGKDLAKVEPALLSPGLAQAFARVNYYYRNAVENRGNKRIKLAGGSDAARFQHFGSEYREKGQATVSYETMTDRFAVKVSGTAALDPSDDKTLRIDESYVAMILGNWVLSAGAINQWWGPSFDSALHKSNNARPMPSIMLTRNDAHGFETPWLSWAGPWTLTTGFSLMENERYAPKALLWNFRGTVRPLRQIEVGFSWTMQFCGEGQECDWKTWAKAIIGEKDCRNDTGGGCTNYGNQMAGFDIRYADTWFDIPVGIYLDRTCEDSNGKAPWNIVDCASLTGIDTRFEIDDQQYKLFAEYTDTMVDCGASSSVFNCFYEHSIYRSGNRYYKRALGSTYDSDAKVIALGLIGQFSNSRGFTSILRYAKLNKDGVVVDNGWAPKTEKEDLIELEFSYRQPMWSGMVTLGGTVSQSEFEVDDKDTNATLFGSYEYRF